jgi:hypothetical protein
MDGPTAPAGCWLAGCATSATSPAPCPPPCHYLSCAQPLSSNPCAGTFPTPPFAYATATLSGLQAYKNGLQGFSASQAGTLQLTGAAMGDNGGGPRGLGPAADGITAFKAAAGSIEFVRVSGSSCADRRGGPADMPGKSWRRNTTEDWVGAEALCGCAVLVPCRWLLLPGYAARGRAFVCRCPHADLEPGPPRLRDLWHAWCLQLAAAGAHGRRPVRHRRPLARRQRCASPAHGGDHDTTLVRHRLGDQHGAYGCCERAAGQLQLPGGRWPAAASVCL